MVFVDRLVQLLFRTIAWGTDILETQLVENDGNCDILKGALPRNSLVWKGIIVL